MQRFKKVSISIETANKLNRLKDKLVAVPTSTSISSSSTLEKVYKNAKEIRELQK